MKNSSPLLDDKLFKVSIYSTAASIIACLALHIVAIVTMAGAIGWFVTIEHGLIFAAIASSLLMIYAVFRHKMQVAKGRVS